MLEAMNLYDRLSKADIKQCAIEFATLNEKGISTDINARYTIPTLPKKNLSGYQTLAFFYVAVKRAFPSMSELTKLPFDKPYELALIMKKCYSY